MTGPSASRPPESGLFRLLRVLSLVALAALPIPVAFSLQQDDPRVRSWIYTGLNALQKAVITVSPIFGRHEPKLLGAATDLHDKAVGLLASQSPPEEADAHRLAMNALVGLRLGSIALARAGRIDEALSRHAQLVERISDPASARPDGQTVRRLVDGLALSTAGERDLEQSYREVVLTTAESRLLRALSASGEQTPLVWKQTADAYRRAASEFSNLGIHEMAIENAVFAIEVLDELHRTTGEPAVANEADAAAHQLAAILIAAGLQDRALTLLDRKLSLAPGGAGSGDPADAAAFADASTLAGMAHLAGGRYFQAETLLKLADALDRESARGADACARVEIKLQRLEGLGDALTGNGSYREAAETYRKALAAGDESRHGTLHCWAGLQGILERTFVKLSRVYGLAGMRVEATALANALGRRGR